jgi:hypothetical protein
MTGDAATTPPGPPIAGGTLPASARPLRDLAIVAIRALQPAAARMLAVEILLTEPEALGDDVLESSLYLLRERMRAA